jgi:hypothetical protein
MIEQVWRSEVLAAVWGGSQTARLLWCTCKQDSKAGWEQRGNPSSHLSHPCVAHSSNSWATWKRLSSNQRLSSTWKSLQSLLKSLLSWFPGQFTVVDLDPKWQVGTAKPKSDLQKSSVWFHSVSVFICFNEISMNKIVHVRCEISSSSFKIGCTPPPNTTDTSGCCCDANSLTCSKKGANPPFTSVPLLPFVLFPDPVLSANPGAHNF